SGQPSPLSRGLQFHELGLLTYEDYRATYLSGIRDLSLSELREVVMKWRDGSFTPHAFAETISAVDVPPRPTTRCRSSAILPAKGDRARCGARPGRAKRRRCRIHWMDKSSPRASSTRAPTPERRNAVREIIRPRTAPPG